MRKLHLQLVVETMYNINNASVNSSCAQHPPGLLRGICPPCQSRGWGICKFWAARGRAFAKPGAIPELLTRTRFAIRKQLHRGFYWQRKQIGSSVKDRKNWRGLWRHVLDFMHAFLHCLSSQNYIAKSGAIDVNQRFLVIESNFCWDYLKNILSY